MERDNQPRSAPEHDASHHESAHIQGSDEQQARINDLETRLQAATEAAERDDLLESMYRKGTTIKRIEAKIEQQETFAVFFLDINNFKQYNDLHGHLAGDKLLLVIEKLLLLIKELLQERFRRVTDHIEIGRYGGDEILLVMTEIVTGDRRSDDINEQLENMTMRLRDIVPALYEADPRAAQVKVGFAIGKALFDPENPVDAETLITLADQEMYKDKARQKWEQKGKLARFALSLAGKRPAL